LSFFAAPAISKRGGLHSAGGLGGKPNASINLSLLTPNFWAARSKSGGMGRDRSTLDSPDRLNGWAFKLKLGKIRVSAIAISLSAGF